MIILIIYIIMNRKLFLLFFLRYSKRVSALNICNKCSIPRFKWLQSHWNRWHVKEDHPFFYYKNIFKKKKKKREKKP